VLRWVLAGVEAAKARQAAASISIAQDSSDGDSDGGEPTEGRVTGLAIRRPFLPADGQGAALSIVIC
jgi:hypothetical protein